MAPNALKISSIKPKELMPLELRILFIMSQPGGLYTFCVLLFGLALNSITAKCFMHDLVKHYISSIYKGAFEKSTKKIKKC